MTAFPCSTRCRSHGRWFVGRISCGPPSPCTNTTTLFGVPSGRSTQARSAPVPTGGSSVAGRAVATGAAAREGEHDEPCRKRVPHPRFLRQSRKNTGRSAATASGSESSRTEVVLCSRHAVAGGDRVGDLRDRGPGLRLRVGRGAEEQRRAGELDARSPCRAVGLGAPRRGVHALARIPEPDQHRADAGSLERCRDAVDRERLRLAVGQHDGDPRACLGREEAGGGEIAEGGERRAAAADVLGRRRPLDRDRVAQRDVEVRSVLGRKQVREHPVGERGDPDGRSGSGVAEPLRDRPRALEARRRACGRCRQHRSRRIDHDEHIGIAGHVRRLVGCDDGLGGREREQADREHERRQCPRRHVRAAAARDRRRGAPLRPGAG